MRIPLFDVHNQYVQYKNEIDEAIQKVLASGEYIQGTCVQRLEARVAQYCGTRYAIGVASGSDALYLSLIACGVGKGDEVITTPYTFFATAGAICRTGARPVFVDIDPGTYNLDPEKIETSISVRTKAVIPVHLFGQMAEMDAIVQVCQKHNLWVIEDACQAMGAEHRGRKAGSLGVTGCFSFFPTKNLGCYGDGGMVITADEELANRMRKLCSQGSNTKYFHDLVGLNSRLDEIQAAVLLVKLDHLEEWIDEKNALAHRYATMLRGIVETPWVAPGNKHTYNLYSIRSPRREKIKKHLEECGISCGIYYPLPLHLQKALNHLGYRKADFPEAEKASAQLLSIPFFLGMTMEAVEEISFLIREAVCR